MERCLIGFGIVAVFLIAGCQRPNMPPRQTEADPSFRSALLEEHYSKSPREPQLLKGDRLVLGRVTAVASDQIKVDIGDVQPRFVPLKSSVEKRFSVQPGDHLVLVMNEQNLLVDYHLAGEVMGGHSILQGTIAQNLPIGHEQVVVRTKEGREDSFEIRPAARSKIASIPVGVESLFLLDETNKIVDATFAGPAALTQAQRLSEQKSPIKGAHSRIEGVIVEPLSLDRITIRTSDRRERSFLVRPLVQEKLTGLKRGDAVTVMIDTEDEIIDVAVLPQ